MAQYMQSADSTPFKKLDFKQAGPFPIIEKISSHAFRLGLPLSMK